VKLIPSRASFEKCDGN